MKISLVLAFLGASLSVAAPTATSPNSYPPSKPEPYGPEHSVEHKPWKRHIEAEEDTVEEPASLVKREASATYPEPYPEHSVGHQPWKRHVETEIEEREIYPAPPAYPSGAAPIHYERSVPVMEAPEHFEVLTA